VRWIIGDIHGMLAPLEALVGRVQGRDRGAQFIFVGDYINRGPESKGVIDLLLALPNARFVRGNHDDIFDHVLHGDSFTRRPGDGYRLESFEWFLQHGLDATFRSYGVAGSELDRLRRNPSIKRLQAVCEEIPIAHRRFVRNLPPVVEEIGFFVAHAKRDVENKEPLPLQLAKSDAARQAVLWGRFMPEELAATKSWERPGYFGHTPTDRYAEGVFVPVAAPQVVLLDTAAALHESGRLTAYCHEEGVFVQVDRNGRVATTP
jgi:hypothetical protein